MIFDIPAILPKAFADLSENGFSIGVDFIGFEPNWVHAGYSEKWIEHYISKGYLQLDPTIKHSLEYPGHVTWTELKNRFPSNPVLVDAERFGMSEGNTLSVFIDGSISIVSCAGKPWNQSEVDLAMSLLSALHHIHKRPAKKPVLTPAILAVLKLMSDGLKDHEIAERLGVKKVTVSQRKQRAYELLECKTAAQTISKVVRLGLI